MILRAPWIIILCLCLVLFGISCGDIKPVWKGEQGLNEQGYTLFFSVPCEFSIDLSNSSTEFNGMLELAISYYVKIARTNLPLYLVIEDEEHQIQEFKTNVLIKNEGEWLGMPEENGVDYTITHVAIEDIQLDPGVYSLKIYSNDENSEQIEGVVKIGARLFELSEDEE